MKKGLVISISLIVVGFIFECLHFGTSIRLLEIKFWLIGLIAMVLGVLGILWYAIVPLLENRANLLGKFKKAQRNKSN